MEAGALKWQEVLIIHGFSSCAYPFEKYVLPLRKEGFEVLAFDTPAHGTSDGKLINADIYKQVILETESLYGPLYGRMGHSLGGHWQQPSLLNPWLTRVTGNWF